MGEFVSLEGQQFHDLYVLGLYATPKNRPMWVCECKCSRLSIAAGRALKSRKAKNCYECGRDRLARDFTSTRIGKLVAVREIEKQSKYRIWECRCDCGNIVNVNSSLLANGDKKSCGCLYYEVMSVRMAGKNNPMYGNIGSLAPNWKGDKCITPKNIRERQTSRYKTWRSSIFAKDNYTCQKCGKYGGEIEAHHLDSFDKNIDHRYAINNGVTLCIAHHKHFHDIYGRGNNDRWQYCEWLINEF